MGCTAHKTKPSLGIHVDTIECIAKWAKAIEKHAYALVDVIHVYDHW